MLGAGIFPWAPASVGGTSLTMTGVSHVPRIILSASRLLMHLLIKQVQEGHVMVLKLRARTIEEATSHKPESPDHGDRGAAEPRYPGVSECEGPMTRRMTQVPPARERLLACARPAVARPNAFSPQQSL